MPSCLEDYLGPSSRIVEGSIPGRSCTKSIGLLQYYEALGRTPEYRVDTFTALSKYSGRRRQGMGRFETLQLSRKQRGEQEG